MGLELIDFSKIKNAIAGNGTEQKNIVKAYCLDKLIWTKPGCSDTTSKLTNAKDTNSKNI